MYRNSGRRKQLCRDRPCCYAARGFPCAAAPPAPVIAVTEFLIVGVVGMGRPVRFLQMCIVSALLVLVPDEESYGRAGGFSIINTRDQFYPVVFVSCGGQRRLPGRLRSSASWIK